MGSHEHYCSGDALRLLLPLLFAMGCDQHVPRTPVTATGDTGAFPSNGEPRDCGLDEPPAIELGPAGDDFQPFDAHAMVELERGAQGLTHFSVALRGGGVERRKSDLVLTTFAIDNDGEISTYEQMVRLACVVGGGQEALRVRVIMDSGVAAGDTIDLTVTMVDELDVEVSASQRIELM